MGLVSKQWKPVSAHEVIAEYLASEPHKLNGIPSFIQGIVNSPNLTDSAENHLRLRLLYHLRCFILAEIPPDVAWYEVATLTDDELPELYVIPHCGWDDPGGSHELVKVACRRPQTLRSNPSTWRRPILFGHTRSGPFTILEGNNRFTAYVSDGGSGLHVQAFVGLSPTPCYWHQPDSVRPIAGSLWKDENNWPQFEL